MSVEALLDRLRTMPAGQPVDVAQIRRDIHEEFRAATTGWERVALIKAYNAISDAIERQIQPEDLEEFKKVREAEYRLLLFMRLAITTASSILTGCLRSPDVR